MMLLRCQTIYSEFYADPNQNLLDSGSGFAYFLQTALKIMTVKVTHNHSIPGYRFYSR